MHCNTLQHTATHCNTVSKIHPSFMLDHGKEREREKEGQRERERERKRERDREREKERERESKRESEREREGGRGRERVRERERNVTEYPIENYSRANDLFVFFCDFLLLQMCTCLKK